MLQTILIDDCRPSKVGNRVWRDDNANGLQDPQEPGLKGIIVHLIDALTRQVVQTKHTDDQGRYLFEEVISGNYFYSMGFRQTCLLVQHTKEIINHWIVI